MRNKCRAIVRFRAVRVLRAIGSDDAQTLLTFYLFTIYQLFIAIRSSFVTVIITVHVRLWNRAIIPFRDGHT